MRDISSFKSLPQKISSDYEIQSVKSISAEKPDFFPKIIRAWPSDKHRRGAKNEELGWKAGLRAPEWWFIVPMFSGTLSPLFHLGPCTHSNSSTNAAKLYGLVGAAWRDISWLSYPQQCVAQTVVCFVYDYTLSSDSHIKYLRVFSLLVNNILSFLGCHFSCLIRAVASWPPAYLSWLDKCCL